MPASQKRDDHLLVEAKPLTPPEHVYFTDQRPEFEISVTNKSGHDLGPDAQIRWIIGIGSGQPDPVQTGFIDVPLVDGETISEVIGDELLAYDGHGVLGVAYGGIYGDEGDKKLHSRDSSHIHPLYTFTVWDRSLFETVHEQPKNLQRWVVRLSGLVALLAAIQVLSAVVPFFL